VGFGTWRHRNVNLPDGSEDRAIEIEWLGVDVNYQGQRTEEDASICRTIFETLEDRARSHEKSTSDMPLVLEVDVRNEAAQGVWEHFGFEFFEWAVVRKDRYLRMIRPASQDDDVVVLDRTATEDDRLAAIDRLAAANAREAVEVLVQLGNRTDESDVISGAVGVALGSLIASGLVTEWDGRDLCPVAAGAFLN
jgi:hypothetical protein